MSSDRTVVLVGSGGRLGSVLARELPRSGIQLLAVRRTETQASGDDSVIPMSADAADPSFSALLENKLQDTARPKISLVWNARTIEHALQAQSEAEFRKMTLAEMTLGIVAFCDTVKTLIDRFAERFDSAVVISSIYGINGPRTALYESPDDLAGEQYGIVKAAQIQAVRELSVRHAPAGLRVNAISYGGVEGRVSPQFIERYAALCPAGRMLNDSDLTGPLEFLCSEASSGVTGHNLVVDGGWTIA